MSKTEDFAFPVECHGDKFTCRKTPVIPDLIDVDMDYFDTILVKGQRCIRHLIHVYYHINNVKTLKCEFLVDGVDRDNIPFKILKVLKGYATHVCQHHKKKYFFAHSAALMSLSKIKFQTAVSSKDFNSREEMAQDLTKYLQDKKKADEITAFLRGDESDQDAKRKAKLDALMRWIQSLPDIKDDPDSSESEDDVPDPPLVGVETNPGPEPRPDIVRRFEGPGYLFCGCAQDALGCIVHLCVDHANYLAEHESDLESSDESESPEDDVPDPPLVGVEPNPGPDLVNLTPSFRLHGNYVGPGHTGGKKLGDVDWSTKPVDALDAAARNHDWHYSQQPSNRGAADEILAKRAWRAIAKQDGLIGKAKAAFVAAGMKAMSFIGSRNGTLLLDPPPPDSVHEENKSRAPKDFTQRKRKKLEGASGYGFQQKAAATVPEVVQINGNNGSATNSDDVPKNMQPKKERKIEKKVEKKVEKAIKKKSKTGKPKSAPVQTGLMATTYQETSCIKPYYRDGKRPNVKKTLFSLGIVAAGGTSSGSNFVSGGVNQSIAIDKNVFVGQSIGRDLDNYEMGRIKWAKYWFVPSIGSTTPGACWIFSDPDATDVLPPNTVVQNSLLTSHPGSTKHTIWKDSFSGNCKFNTKWVYLDSAIVTNANTTAGNASNNIGDPRLTTFGVLNFINGENIATSNGALGEWFLELEMEFRAPQYSDLSRFMLSNKVIAASGGNLGTVASTVNFDPFRASQNTGGIQYELSQNPRTVISTGPANGTGVVQFRLTPGCYNFYVRISQSNAGTVSSFTSIFFQFVCPNTVFSITVDRINDPIASNTVSAPEFASALVAGTDALNNGAFGFNARVRVDSVSVGTYAVANIILGATFTGTFTTGAYHCEAIQMPDLSANPICAFHPQGNANGFVGLSEDVRVSIWNGFREDEGNCRVSQMICPREFIEMVKTSLMKRYVDYDEKYCFLAIDNQCGGIFPPLPGSLKHWEMCPTMYVNYRDLKIQDAEKSDHVVTAIINGYDDEVKKSNEPESPEVVENPLSRSIHLRPDVATRLLSLVGARAA